MDAQNIQDAASLFKFGGILPAILFLIVAYIAGRVLTSTLTKLGDRFTERRLFFQQVAAFSRFGFYFVGITLATISVIELRRETILALSGTAGVALGFALKDTASSVLMGLTILIDKPFQVGDRVQVGDVYGDVTAIGLRSVRICTLDDNLVTIPNTKFASEAVASGNAGELNMLVQMDFYVGLDQDIDRAAKIVEEAITTSRYCYLEKPWAVLVSQGTHAEHFALRLRGKAYVLDTKYEKSFESDVTRQVMRAFQVENILPPAHLSREMPAA